MNVRLADMVKKGEEMRGYAIFIGRALVVSIRDGAGPVQDLYIQIDGV